MIIPSFWRVEKTNKCAMCNEITTKIKNKGTGKEQRNLNNINFVFNCNN